MVVDWSKLKSCSEIPATGANKTITLATLQVAFEELRTDSINFNIQKSKNLFNSCPSAQKEMFRKACKAFYATTDKIGDQGVFGYGFCCKANEMCPPSVGETSVGETSTIGEPFYTEIWFFSACGGFVLLLIIIILIVIICCRKK
ncbi:unnamed protein product [Caenorhabditis nigoni]